MAVERVHATAISASGRAVLIRGPSGSGKSDLALRCLSLGPSDILAERARLISDDQVMITREGSALIARPPAQIAGKVEVRGLGIVSLPYDAHGVPVALLADLVEASSVERLPDPWPRAALLGVTLPVLRLAPFEPSAPLKLLMALAGAHLPPQG